MGTRPSDSATLRTGGNGYNYEDMFFAGARYVLHGNEVLNDPDRDPSVVGYIADWHQWRMIQDGLVPGMLPDVVLEYYPNMSALLEATGQADDRGQTAGPDQFTTANPYQDLLIRQPQKFRSNLSIAPHTAWLEDNLDQAVALDYPSISVDPNDLSDVNVGPPSKMPPDPFSANPDPKEIDAIFEADYNEMVGAYPLLHDAMLGLAYFMDEQEGVEVPHRSYAVINLEDGTISHSEEKPIDDHRHLISYSTDDVNRGHVVEAGYDILSERIAGKIDVASARARIDELMAEIGEFHIEKLHERTIRHQFNLYKLKEELRKVQEEKERLEQLFKTCNNLTVAPLGESPTVPKLKKRISTLSEEIRRKERALRGMARSVVFQQTMLTMAEARDGAPEDVLLSQAGSIMGSFGLDKEAYDYFCQAQEVAIKLGDKASAMQQEFYKIKFNPDLNDEERIRRSFGFIKSLEEVCAGEFLDPVLGRELSYEQINLMEEDLEQFYVTLRAEAVAETVRFAAVYAEDDPDNEYFRVALTMLDHLVDQASTTSDANTMQIVHLIRGSLFTIEPIVRQAENEVRGVQIEERGVLIKQVLDRAKRVEKMYHHHVTLNPQDRTNPYMADALATFGEQSYFYALQRTGFAYDAICMVMGRYVPLYPDSPVKGRLVAILKDKAPHLFDKYGRFIPVDWHFPALDAEEAASEVDKLNILPGTMVEGIGYDLAGSVAGATGGAKLGALLCSGTGPGGAAACGAVGGLVGFFVGIFGGAATLRYAYSDEIDVLEHQARMAGMNLAGLVPGEGDKHVAMVLGFFALAAFFGPAGREFSVSIGNRIVNMMRPSRLRYLYEYGKCEGRHLLKGVLGSGRGLRGAARVWPGKGGDASLSLISERMSTTLGVGSRQTAKRLREAEEVIINEARAALETNIHNVVKNGSDGFAKKLSELIVSDIPDAPARLKRFKKLLNRVKSTSKEGSQGRFQRKMAKIFGLEKDDSLVRSVSDYVFSDLSVARTRASQLGDAFLAASSNKDEFVNKLTRALSISDAPQMVIELSRAVGPADVPKLLRMVRLLRMDGIRAVQSEGLLKSLVRSKKPAQELLEEMLIGRTQQEVREMAKVAWTWGKKAKEAAKKAGGSAKKGVPLDEHALTGVMTKNGQSRVYDAVRNAMNQYSTIEQLATKDFFDQLLQVEGMKRFLISIRERLDLTKLRKLHHHITLTQILGHREYREQIIRIIASDKNLFKRFVELTFGKGLEEKARWLMPKEARETFLNTIFRPAKDKNGAVMEGMVNATKEIQHAMKDVMRPVLQDWRTTALAEIHDVSVRARRRVQRRALSQAIAMLDEAGEEFGESILQHLAPRHWKKYEQYLPQGFAKLRAETQKTLAGQVIKAMKFRPDEGYLDKYLWHINWPLTRVAGFVDRWWARRLDLAKRAAIAADLDMSFRHHPFLWRKMLLRSAHLAKMAAKKPPVPPKAPGKFVRGFERFHEWMSRKITTEQLRLAHRYCLIYSAPELAQAIIDGSEMSEDGVLCLMFGSNYYVEKLGLGKVFALDIAMGARTLGTLISKADADSDDWLDKKRTFWTHVDMITMIGAQTFAMYGLNFAEKTPLGQVLGQIPILRRLSLSMTSFFGTYRNTLAKPEFLVGGGIWGGVKGMGISTAISAAIAYGMNYYVFKNKRMFNASDDLAMWRASNYIVNGGLVNTTGFLVNRRLEANNPDADLRSSARQLVERGLGLITQYVTLQLADVYAGKGDFKTKQDRLLQEAVSGDLDSKLAAWNVFGSRFSFDLTGWWYRVKPFSLSVEPGRTLTLHMGASFHLDQLKSWYTEGWMEFSDEVYHQGYFVELARKHPERLKQFLEAARWQMENPGAKWRSAFFAHRREAHSKALYYFSLMAKFYAHRVKDYPEYQPFVEFISDCRYKKYWALVPLCKTEEELQRTIIRMEDRGEVGIDEEGRMMSLDDLLARIRTAKSCPGQSEPRHFVEIFKIPSGSQDRASGGSQDDAGYMDLKIDEDGTTHIIEGRTKKRPFEGVTVDEKPPAKTEKKPLKVKTVDEKPAEDKTVDEKPPAKTEKKPLKVKTVDEKPTEDKTVDKKSAEDKTEEKPAEGKTDDEKPKTNKRPPDDKTIEKSPPDERP